jgi:hypothetical protein
MLAAIVLAGLFVGSAAAQPCAFDTTGDGTPDLVLPDADGDGACEFPQKKTKLPGTLTVPTGTTIEFLGSTIVTLDGIVIESGATLRGEVATLRSLSLIALAGDLVVDGTLDLALSDDLDLVARAGAVRVRGPTRVVATEVIVLDARGGDVELAPPALEPGGGFTLLGGLGVTLRARASDATISVVRARIGGRKVAVSARVSPVSAPGVGVDLREGTVLTSDPAATGILSSSGDVRVDGARLVRVDGATLDSARNLRIGTRRAGDDLCLGGGSLLEARHPDGTLRTIQLTRVRGTVTDDGTTTFSGVLQAPAIVAGTCP